MNTRVVQNFRGMRVAVLHAPDRNRQVLTETLAKLGLSTIPIDPQGSEALPSKLFESVDMVFFDADMTDDALGTSGSGTPPVPLIAVLGHETPSRLQRAFELNPAALLHKPVRPTGIYTALFFAVNEHRRRQELVDRLADVEARHSARRFVVKAVLALAERNGIDDDEAYRMLRRESMQQRITVEEMAVRLLATIPGNSARKIKRA